MPTRQYIGARYVPKFFYGTGGSAEWVANTQYEALTIVTRNGNSYTSRKPVPTSVGAPEDNPEYWVSTGIYNEQVEEYRAAVDALDDRVDDVEENAIIGAKTSMLYGKKVVVYGDSLSSDTYNYWRYIISAGIDVTNRSAGGSSLEGTISTLTSATDLTDFDVVFLGFGTNEWQASYEKTRVESSIKSAVNILRTKNPIMPIYFITPFWSKNAEFNSGVDNVNEHGMTLEDYCNIYNDCASALGCGVIDFYHCSGCGPENYQSLLGQSISYGDIWVHENDTFSKILADLILNATYNTNKFESNVCKRNYIDVLNFGAYKVNVDTFYGSGFPAGARGGLVISSSSMMQAAGWTYLPSVPMRLTGYANAGFTFKILIPNTSDYADEVHISAGYFDYKFTPTINGGKITFVPDSGTLILGKLMLCEINTNEDFTNLYGFGYQVSSSVATFTQPIRLVADDKYITISDAVFTLNSNLNALDTLGTFPAHMTPDGIYAFAFSGSTVYPLMFSGNGQVRPLVNINAGTYRLMGGTHIVER